MLLNYAYFHLSSTFKSFLSLLVFHPLIIFISTCLPHSNHSYLHFSVSNPPPSSTCHPLSHHPYLCWSSTLQSFLSSFVFQFPIPPLHPLVTHFLIIPISAGHPLSNHPNFPLSSTLQSFPLSHCHCHPAIHLTNDIWPSQKGDQISAKPVVYPHCEFLDPDNWIPHLHWKLK